MSVTAPNPKFIFMICKAIGGTKSGNKGASRAAIAKYIIENFGKTAGGLFNAALRRALKKGIEAGVLKQGATAQRFKFGDNVKSITNPPKATKKKAKKKKVTKKKKPATKKKAAKKSAKKKTTKKKKTARKSKK